MPNMKTKVRISKIISILILLSFLLPFYPSGCAGLGPSAAEKAEKAKNDSIAVAAKEETIKDSLASIGILNKDSLEAAINKAGKKDSCTCCATEAKDSLSTPSGSSNSNDFTITDRLAKSSKIAKVLLRPNNNYSGLGFLIDYFLAWISYSGTIIAFICLVVVLCLKKSFDKNRIVINSLNFINILLLYFANNPEIFLDVRLWGFWICFSLAIMVAIFDLVITIKSKKAARG
jgi:hypothetical protein